VVNPWRYIGIGHSVVGHAKWLELIRATGRSIRFAACLPGLSAQERRRFGHVPPCDHAGLFDLLDHIAFDGLDNLRASSADFANATVHSKLSCEGLRSLLMSTRRRLVVHEIHGLALDRCTHTEHVTRCLQKFGARPSPRPQAPAARKCDIGLHLRTLALDHHDCNLVGRPPVPAATQQPPSRPRPRACPHHRTSRCSAQPFPTSISGCAGQLFATADTPRMYEHTRRLGWHDLNETVRDEPPARPTPAPASAHATDAALAGLGGRR
jgi:hypothetical protein